ncbi:putative vesicular-fusion protein sec17 [Wickerhamiella sorbophila]|uniref:Putative vesicular-fusion protein sec17 n=1 Tax=Wickerhamiella sorbophila TaxID=45607 RepID=A0A2T0FM88_9ASCO|nr:putative vesicular-fusion protein sec17 [Wickerhamiella sorbophila]PRT56102.1 putative vesicular-fusion protein sec17 [Wickerhamiella sorbophila]
MDPQALLAQADKKATTTGGFFTKVFGGSSFQLEEAADLYIQAANGFRLNKDQTAAGKAFEKAATVQKQTDLKDDAANTLVEAYKSYRQVDPEQAVRVLDEAIHLFTLRGQFRRAANYQMDIGAVYENDLADLAKAIKAYQDAGDWYYNDQAEALSNKAFLKVADLAALNGQYDMAIENFERVAKQSLNSNLSKWSLKEYFVKATMCYLAEGDFVATSRALDQYNEWDPSFGSTKEFQFLTDIAEAVKDGDEQAYTDKLWEYDRFNKLDKWKVSMGLKIKEQIQGAEDDLL